MSLLLVNSMESEIDWQDSDLVGIGIAMGPIENVQELKPNCI